MNENEFVERLNQIRTFFHAGHTRPVSWRKQQLRALKTMLSERYDDLAGALHADLRKNALEIYASEIGFVTTEIEHALDHIDAWMRPANVYTPPFMHPATGFVMYEPLGVALIMGAWNYPLHLTLAPLVPAIAAGNAAVIKPPRTAGATARIIADLLPEYLDQRAYFVVPDGISNEFMLEQAWDKIFLTGSGKVGKIVMQAAARRLIPVTLELGGKSPAFVDPTVNLPVAARRIVNGRFFNAGQTCVAPDYVLAHKDIAEKLVSEMAAAVQQFYGEDPQQSADYARIINTGQFDRLVSLLNEEQVAVGGKSDRDDLYIAPTILRDVSPDAPIMEVEIFGPILPVITIDDIQQGIDYVIAHDKPLALYIFSENRQTVEMIMSRTSSGGVCVNETMYHLAVPDLPFGGVGPSGMGKYHGEWGFKDFSNARAVLDRETGFDPDLIYPPYNENKIRKLKTLMETQFRLPGFVDRTVTNLYKFVLRKFGNRIMNR